jgi:peptidoglycan hydrolase CwlO-like protein
LTEDLRKAKACIEESRESFAVKSQEVDKNLEELRKSEETRRDLVSSLCILAKKFFGQFLF